MKVQALQFDGLDATRIRTVVPDAVQVGVMLQMTLQGVSHAMFPSDWLIIMPSGEKRIMSNTEFESRRN